MRPLLQNGTNFHLWATKDLPRSIGSLHITCCGTMTLWIIWSYSQIFGGVLDQGFGYTHALSALFGALPNDEVLMIWTATNSIVNMCHKNLDNEQSLFDFWSTNTCHLSLQCTRICIARHGLDNQHLSNICLRVSVPCWACNRGRRLENVSS